MPFWGTNFREWPKMVLFGTYTGASGLLSDARGHMGNHPRLHPHAVHMWML
jgi:hypothetical protein